MGIPAFSRSLVDLLGSEYIEAVISAASVCTDTRPNALRKIASGSVPFWSDKHTERLNRLATMVGDQVCEPFAGSAHGAGSEGFEASTKRSGAPLSGFGCVRIGEDGRAYFIAKAEHYHVSFGHRFPGFALLDRARALGILQPEHNNMRGHVTRLLEERLVGLAGSDPEAPDRRGELSKIINLQTGSLAAEAALKMMLARFFRVKEDSPEPPYIGRRPVVLVLADSAGGLGANYHGTTMVTQMLRGMWPEFTRSIRRNLEIVPVPINDSAAFRTIVSQKDKGKRKVAGFFHEFVLMNYGCIRLDPDELRSIYALCKERDIPVAADEIQTGAWSADGFFFREYGVHPDIVALGKGFPGGEYAASRIMTTPAMDNLDQFGALVTNGQEEIASLAYLVVLETINEMRDHLTTTGHYYQSRLKELVTEFPRSVQRIEGTRHLSSIFFASNDQADDFARRMNHRCIEISTHSYKSESPPAAITKLPVIVTEEIVDMLIESMKITIREMEAD